MLDVDPQPLLDALPFEDWIRWVFDHPPREPAWHFDGDAPYWDPSADPRRTVGHLHRLFAAPRAVLAPYDDAQVAQGLSFLVLPTSSRHAETLVDSRVPLKDRVHAIRAMETLYAELFAPRCAPVLAHRPDDAAGPLNVVCHMWWDYLPIAADGAYDHPHAICSTCLDVMEGALAIDSLACRESALHGLGHWQAHHRGRVWKAVTAFLDANPTIEPRLRSYALFARSGHVF